MSQGAVFGPLHFPIYKNYIDEGLPPKISKFAGDTKKSNIIDSVVGDDNILQEDLKKLFQLSEDSQIPFNIEKCSA